MVKKVDDVLSVLIDKEGNKFDMPNLYVAQSFAEGIWKGKVDRIEVTQVYKY